MKNTRTGITELIAVAVTIFLAISVLTSNTEAEAVAVYKTECPGIEGELTQIKAPGQSTKEPGWSMFWGSLVYTNVTIFQTLDIKMTADELAACQGKVVFEDNVAIWNHQPPNPDYPPLNTLIGWTCEQIKRDGLCFEFDGTFKGDLPIKLDTQITKVEQAPQKCGIRRLDEDRGQIKFYMTPGWKNKYPGYEQDYYDSPSATRCWIEVAYLFPYEFGSTTVVLDNVRNNPNGDNEADQETVAFTVNIEEEEVPTPTPTPTPTNTGGPIDPTPTTSPTTGPTSTPTPTPTPTSTSTPTPTPEDPGPVDIDYEGNIFGEVEIYQSKIQTIKITNKSGFAIPVESIKIRADNEDQWLKVKQSQSCALLQARACKVDVQFFPRNDGPQAAILDVKLETVEGYELEIPLVGVGYTYPADEGQRPPPPAAPRPPDTPDQEVEKVEPGTYVVVTKKNKVKIKFTPPGGAEAYEWRKKRNKWTKWHSVDPEPNKKGFVTFTVPMKKYGCYKIQARAVSPNGYSGRKTIEVCKEPPALPGLG